MLEFLKANASDLATIVIAAHALAVMIVNLTPTPKDNAVLETIYRWVIAPLAGLFTKEAQG